MTSQPKTTAQMYEELTDEQVVERLAKDVMGWHEGKCWFVDSDNLPVPEASIGWLDKNGNCMEGVSRWNPLTDWNHFRQLEEKVMEDETLWHYFLKKLGAITGDIDHHIGIYMEAHLSVRCRAVLAAWDSLNTR